MINGEIENRNKLLYTNGKHINLSLTTFSDFLITQTQLPRTESHLLFTAFVGLIVTLLLNAVPKFQLSSIFSLFFLPKRKQKRHKNVSHPTEIFFEAPRGILHPSVSRIKTMSFAKRDFHVDESFLSLFTFVTIGIDWNEEKKRV